MTDDDDTVLISMYRGASLEMPDPALDRKILRAANSVGIYRIFLPIGLAMAAGLTLAWIVPWHAAGPAASRHPAVASDITPGLYEGRIAQELADPATTRYSAFEQMPGGTEGKASHGS
jgi:hypothetical protein